MKILIIKTETDTIYQWHGICHWQVKGRREKDKAGRPEGAYTNGEGSSLVMAGLIITVTGNIGRRCN